MILLAICTADVDDVREVLQYYRQFDNPLAQFRENQRKLQQMQEKQLEEHVSKPSPVKRWTPTFLGHK